MTDVQAAEIELPHNVGSECPKRFVFSLRCHGIELVSYGALTPRHSDCIKCFAVPIRHKSPNVELTGAARLYRAASSD